MYEECRIAAAPGYKPAFERFVPHLEDFYRDPGSFQIEPFRIFGNLWYVGDRNVCMHLIDTGEGLILFDTGYRNAFPYLLESIRKAGFDPADIKYVIHSHGHFDHFGGSIDLRHMFNPTICMSRVDTELLREKPERALVELGPMRFDEICWPDVELDDGQEITLGNTTILCRLAPGHTWGTMAFFFNVTDGKETKRVGYWGGVGFLTIYKDYCRDMGLPENKSEAMLKSVEMLRKEKVDITIGNHPSQNCTIDKREWMLSHPGTNPFLNPGSWQILLNTVEQRCREFIEKGF